MHGLAIYVGKYNDGVLDPFLGNGAKEWFAVNQSFNSVGGITIDMYLQFSPLLKATSKKESVELQKKGIEHIYIVNDSKFTRFHSIQNDVPIDTYDEGARWGGWFKLKDGTVSVTALKKDIDFDATFADMERVTYKLPIVMIIDDCWNNMFSINCSKDFDFRMGVFKSGLEDIGSEESLTAVDFKC